MARNAVAQLTPLSGDDPDEPLIRQARAGDASAFGQLVSRCKNRVYRLTLRLAGNVGDGEDILQETFLNAFNKLDSFRGRSHFSTWLYRIAINTALMHRRSSRRHATEPLDEYLPQFRRDGRHKRIDIDYSAASRVEAVIERRELMRLLLAALSRLPERYRVAVVLCDLEEMSSAAASVVLGVDAATLRQRVHRGRLMLRGYLDAVARGERR